MVPHVDDRRQNFLKVGLIAYVPLIKKTYIQEAMK
jgi:hypothetical protein